MWTAAFLSWIGRPLGGHGLGAPLQLGSDFRFAMKTQYHNYPIQLLHNTGLIGFVLVTMSVGLWVSRVRETTRRTRSLDHKVVRGAMFVFLTVLFFYGLYGHSLSYPPVAILSVFCVAILSLPESPDVSNRRVHDVFDEATLPLGETSLLLERMS